MKKILRFFLLMVLAFVLATSAFAANSTEMTVERIDLENGDYAIVTTYVEAPALRINQKIATRIFEYYTNDNRLAWIYTLRGTFAYDGSKAIAVSSDGSCVINDSRWTCTESDYYSGATVYGTVTGRTSSLTRTGHLTITCSPNGTITGTTK